jgi:hypothetical protein
MSQQTYQPQHEVFVRRSGYHKFHQSVTVDHDGSMVVVGIHNQPYPSLPGARQIQENVHMTSLDARALRDALNAVLGDEPAAEYEVVGEFNWHGFHGQSQVENVATQDEAEWVRANWEATGKFQSVNINRVTREEA